MKKTISILLALSCVATNICSVVMVNQIPRLGKTHFIVGYPSHNLAKRTYTTSSKNDVSQKKDAGRAKEYTVEELCKKQCFFTETHDIRTIRITLINDAQDSILIAAYTITDKSLVDALIEKHKQKVRVEIITDFSNIHEKSSKVKMLVDSGIPVSYWNSEPYGLMHHKFMIFDEKMVITGSSNLTQSGQGKNREDIFIVSESHPVQRYCRQFERLKTACKPCDKNMFRAK